MRHIFNKIPEHRRERIKLIAISAIAALLLLTGGMVLWAATIPLPSVEQVEQGRISQSTKIYDKTGEILLYDMHQDVKRTIVPFDQISPYVKQATIAIEDDNFYHHFGIEPLAILRAILINIKNGNLLGGQGGSTITQQVIKNSVLVRDKTIARKLKEWVLAVKLERVLSKDEILNLYLNISPYGGNKYGIEEASQSFFGKPAKDLDIAESAYLASLPQAPTYYSPYGNNKVSLDRRKNIVLDKMLKQGYITEQEHDVAEKEVVRFLPPQATGIKAPHFVFYVIQQLEDKYGKEALDAGGYKVITTLDWNLESAAEKIVYDHAKQNETTYNASNAALVAIDPKTGGILSMVGSRDYFDTSIDGNYNIALATRQPGSSFKPFVYAEALLKGYTPQTVVFDARTQFSTTCAPDNFTSDNGCYSPTNYDGVFRGPITFRNALAQSVNVPAIKVFYLAGLKDSLQLAERLGISTLGNIGHYGLTLVLGGGEVTLLDMTGAYSVFANEGIRTPPQAIQRVEDSTGKVIDEFTPKSSSVLDRQVALQITDMLADNDARAPAFGPSSYLNFPGYDVAVKTGTTNEYRDAWVIGYTPDIVVGAWAGNNDNTPMEKKVAGFIVAPLWHDFLEEVFKKQTEVSHFTAPDPIPYDTLKPVLRGQWQGGQSYFVDKITGKLATDNTPAELREERFVSNAHNILYWVNRNDPRGPAPTNPSSDGQYALWEYGVQAWLAANNPTPTPSGTSTATTSSTGIPTENDDVHSPEKSPVVTILEPKNNVSFAKNDHIAVHVETKSTYPATRADFFVNGLLIGSSNNTPFSFAFTPSNIDGLAPNNSLTVVVYDAVLNRGQATVNFAIKK